MKTKKVRKMDKILTKYYIHKENIRHTYIPAQRRNEYGEEKE